MDISSYKKYTGAWLAVILNKSYFEGIWDIVEAAELNRSVPVSKKQSLFEEVGGLPILQKVHKIFYDKVYMHPWLKKYFEGHDQKAIENRQTSFMATKMGGSVDYWGKQPKMAHRQMYITAELYDIRHELLRESLSEAGVPRELALRWLKIDYAFKRQIVKQSVESFYKTTWQFEKRVIIPKSWCD